MGSTPEAARPSGRGVEGGADRAGGIFGSRRGGKLVWCERGFGFERAGLQPPDFRRGFGLGGERAGSSEPAGTFGCRTGGRAVWSPLAFGSEGSGSMSELRGSSDARSEGRASHPWEPRLRRIEWGSARRGFGREEQGRRFGSAGLRFRRGGATARLDGTSVPEGELRLGSKRASVLQWGLRFPAGHCGARGSGDRSARQGFGSGEMGSGGSARRGFGLGGKAAAIRVRGGFGLRGRERERDAEMGSSGTNVKRGSAPETAYGQAAGEMLWRAQPHERIRHETRPAGSRRIETRREVEKT
jgi:hypothetical protein